MRNTFGLNVTCFMVLVCIVLGHGVSAAYAPNMGNQGTSVHNNHHLGQVNNVSNVPFAQDNASDNLLPNSPLLHNWDAQDSIELSNDSSSMSPIVLSFNTSPISTEFLSSKSLARDNLNKNELFNDYSNIMWEEPTTRFKSSPCLTQQTNSKCLNEQYDLSSNNSPACFKPLPCFMQQPITPLHSVELNHNPHYGQQPNTECLNKQDDLSSNNSPACFKPLPCFMQQPITPLHSVELNHNPHYGQQPNTECLNEQYDLSSNNSPACFKPSPYFMQQLITPLHSVELNHNSLIQNNLNDDQQFNISPLSSFLGEEEHSIVLQEKSILDPSNLPKSTNLITTIENKEVPRAMDVNALLPMIDASHQRKKRKIIPVKLDKCESIPLTSKNNIALPKHSQSVISLLFKEASRDALKDRKSIKEVPMTLLEPTSKSNNNNEKKDENEEAIIDVD